jgi:hypothetical protein
MIEITIKDTFGSTVEIGDTVELFIMEPGKTSSCGTGKVYYDPKDFAIKVKYSPPEERNDLEKKFLQNQFARFDFLHNWKERFKLLKRGDNESINNG